MEPRLTKLKYKSVVSSSRTDEPFPKMLLALISCKGVLKVPSLMSLDGFARMHGNAGQTSTATMNCRKTSLSYLLEAKPGIILRPDEILGFMNQAD